MEKGVSGILVLNKPARISSAGALTRIKHLFPRQTRPKIGHAGTLDPFATGVLLVLIGRASTRRCEELMGQPKRYRATVKLGARTPSLDPTWPETPDPSPRVPSESEVLQALPQFIGTIQQTPPAFCALKRNGQSLYHRARKGHEVQLEPRPVNVYELSLLRYAYPELELDVHCGKGTYIRSLARDIAEKLGTTGYLTALCRTAVGEFRVEDAVELEGITLETVLARLK